MNNLGRLIGICCFPTIRSSSSAAAAGAVPGLATLSTIPSTTPILKVGDVLRVERTFTEADVVDYARVSGDANRVHLDDEFARAISPRFRGRVVHGMLVASLFPAVIASHFPGAIYASQTLQFKLPVYIGEEVMAEVESINIRENKKTYITKFLTRCLTGKDALVLQGEATAILPTLSGYESMIASEF